MGPESPKAPPAALERRLSTPRGGPKSAAQKAQEGEQRREAAEQKREAQLQARVDKAAESAIPAGMRTPRGAHTPPRAPGSDPPPVAPLQLKLARPAADAENAAPSAGCATPRSAYSRASNEAKAAAADSRAGGSARSMLHRHVKQNT